MEGGIAAAIWPLTEDAPLSTNPQQSLNGSANATDTDAEYLSGLNAELKIVLIPICFIMAPVAIGLIAYTVLSRRKSKQSVQAKVATKTSAPDKGEAILTQRQSLLLRFFSREVVVKDKETSPPPAAEGTYELGVMPVARVREMI